VSTGGTLPLPQKFDRNQMLDHMAKIDNTESENNNQNTPHNLHTLHKVRQGNVLFISAEDDLADTIAPRLIAAGANMERIFSYAESTEQRLHYMSTLFEELIRQSKPSVVICDPDDGYIDKVGALHNPAHLPIGTTGLRDADRDKPNRAALNEWWLGRSVPASRDKIEAALCALDLRSPAALIIKCYGLSLSDHYWVLLEDYGLAWDGINFFKYDFSKDIGDVLFGHEPKDRLALDLISPDNASDDWLRKKWSVRDGKRILIKGGSGVFEQEPF
jgi:hypothetical protein